MAAREPVAVHTGFVIKLDNAGDFSGDKKVEQTL